MPAIVKALKAMRLKNVGVLPFRVKQGAGKAGFSTPLNSSLATRIENLLIIHSGPKEAEALGVIHDAGLAASKQKVASWFAVPGNRKKLFEVSYPLAWGTQKVKADAFLTGLVKTSKDLRQTTVTLEYLDHRDPSNLIELSAFTIKTDRNILRDLGYSFALAQKARPALVADRGSPENADELVLEQLSKQQGNKKEDTSARPDNVGGIKVELVVESTPSEIRESTAGEGPKWQVECPGAGKKVFFRLKNTSTRELGVVLRLNGVNTIDQQKFDPEGCRKWIIPAGKTYTIKGFYLVGGDEPDGRPRAGPDKVFPFKVMVDKDASAIRSEMGDKVGLIQVDVFEPGSGEPKFTVNAKGMEPSKEVKARQSYSTLRTTLLKSARLKAMAVAEREVLTLDTTPLPKPSSELKVVPFGPPQFVASLTIKIVPAEGGPDGTPVLLQ
jgi:hypothetical protein